RILRIKLEHWHQFDCGHAEFFEIWDFLGETRKGAASFHSDSGTRMPSEAAHVHFVYDGLRRRPLEWCVSFPIVSTRIRHNGLNRRRSVVAFLSGRVATVVLWNHRAAP